MLSIATGRDAFDEKPLETPSSRLTGYSEVGAKGKCMATMNVVPLIDILLALIIIFMVITPLTPKGLDALIPQPAEGVKLDPGPKTIVVRVLGEEKLKTNDEDATWDSLGMRLSAVFKERARESRISSG